jgi:hypothetical protein
MHSRKTGPTAAPQLGSPQKAMVYPTGVGQRFFAGAKLHAEVVAGAVQRCDDGVPDTSYFIR